MSNHERQLRQAIKRLEKSGGPLARRRARQHLRNTLKGIERKLFSEYPTLRKDGTIVEPKKVRGVACPACGVPFKGYAQLAKHVALNHTEHPTLGFADCWCGSRFHLFRDFARHLAGVKDLKQHAVMGAMRRLADES